LFFYVCRKWNGDLNGITELPKRRFKRRVVVVKEVPAIEAAPAADAAESVQEE